MIANASREIWLVIPDVNKTMTSFRGQASLAKMTSLGGKLTALACHPTKRVNKAEERTYFSTNISYNLCKRNVKTHFKI
jgi:hypothetical protein